MDATYPLSLTQREVKRRHKVCAVMLTGLCSISALPAFAATASFDAVNFRPASDQGSYINVEQSQTLGQWGSAVGVSGDFSTNSFFLKDPTGAKIQNVIQRQLSLDLGAALGLTKWLDVGVNIGGVPFQEFVTPGTLTQANGARMGDMRVNMKVRIINNEDSPIGLAVVPFLTIPTGKGEFFTGNGNVTGGGKFVLDTKRFADRVSFALNAGGQVRQDIGLPGGTDIGDQFLYGAAANVQLAKPLQLIAEINGRRPFKNFLDSNNTNLTIDGAVRLLPDVDQHIQLTAGGGAGLSRGTGAPDWHVFATVAYRMPRKAAPDVPAREEVITTNKIHFGFNKSNIRPESYPVIESIVANIQHRPEVQHVRVEGHTDSVGSDLYNQKLSERRANAIRTFIIGKNYPAAHIDAVGVGESAPIADNTTKAGRAQNRRVEFHLQMQPGSRVHMQRDTTPSPTYEEGDTVGSPHRHRS